MKQKQLKGKGNEATTVPHALKPSHGMISFVPRVHCLYPLSVHAFIHSFLPSALEQDIVPWKKDSESKRCMKCSREFNIHRRKHHCRLCGDVICKKCSSFFPFSEAC